MNWSKWLACGVLSVAATAARADIKYTQETTMPENSNYKSIMVRAVKPNFERYESTTDMGVYKMQDITIRECGKKQTIKLAPDLKIYAVVPDGHSASSAGGVASTPANNSGKPTTGKMVMKYGVKDLGLEEVAGFKARHYVVDMESTSSGCAGDGTTKHKYELWVTDIRQPNPCPNDTTFSSVSEAMSRPDCKIEVVQQGDFQAYADINKGLVVKQIIYNNDKPMMIMTTTSLSQAKLGDDLFVVPTGYKQVTPAEFDKQKSDAMMKAMSGGTTARSDDGDDENRTAANDDQGDDGNDANADASPDADDTNDDQNAQNKKDENKQKNKNRTKDVLRGVFNR